jgi:hypothetical protein
LVFRDHFPQRNKKTVVGSPRGFIEMVSTACLAGSHNWIVEASFERFFFPNTEDSQ